MNQHTYKLATVGILASLVTLFGFAFFTKIVYGNAIVSDQGAVSDKTVHYQFFASSTVAAKYATTTSATSTNLVAYFDSSGRLVDGALDVRGAKKVTLYFSRGDTTGQGNTGLSVFSVEVTPDRSTWYDFNRLLGQDVSETATSSVTINAATSTTVVHMDLDNQTYQAVRCIVVETTDGEHTCAATVEY